MKISNLLVFNNPRMINNRSTRSTILSLFAVLGWGVLLFITLSMTTISKVSTKTNNSPTYKEANNNKRSLPTSSSLHEEISFDACTIPVTFTCQVNRGDGWSNDADCAYTVCAGEFLNIRVKQKDINYTYAWTDPDGILVANTRNLTLRGILAEHSGTYSLLITDTTTSCTGNLTFDVTVLDATTSIVHPSCSGAADGSITLSPINTTGPVTYSIDGTNYQSATTFTGLTEGPYTITMIDASISDTCFTLDVVLNAITSKAYAISPSCTNNVPDDNGYLQISATTGDRFHYSTGNTFDDNSGAYTYTNATAITTTPITTPAILANPGSDSEYTIRIYNGPSCFKDVVVTLKPQTCVQGCECTEYMYLNEISHGGSIHKFALDADYDASTDPSTAVIGTEIGNPWYNNFANREALSFPHGLGIDNNGFLYIGETGSLDNNLDNEIRRFSCDGEPIPSSEFNIPRTAGSNFASNENTLYVNYNDASDPSTSTWITAYDLCDGSLLGYYCLDSLGLDWGLQLLEDGTMLVSSDKRDYNSSEGLPNRFYKFDIHTATLNAPGETNPVCIEPIIREGTSDIMIGSTTFPRNQIWGVTGDNDGNIYVVERIKSSSADAPAGTTEHASRIIKYDSTGTVVDISNYDFNNGDAGYYSAIGIFYVETYDLLFVSTTSAVDDCVSLFDLDLDYLGPAVPATGINSTAKGISVTEECCPINNNVTIDTVLCAANLNEAISLQNFLNCGETICEGTWQADAGNSGITFEECNNTITFTEAGACGTFTFGADGSSNNAQCGAFKITVNIEVGNITSTTISGDQTICAGAASTALTSSISSTSGTLSYQWQSSTTSCSAGFTDISSATAATYDPGTVSQTTYYRLLTSLDAGCATGTCKDTSNCTTLTFVNNPTTTAVATNPTCSGSTVNNNGTITLSGFTTEKYDLVTGSDYSSGSATYATATTIPAGGVITNTLANPSGSQDYTIRIFNNSGCFVDRTITINEVSCGCTNPILTDLTAESICMGDNFTTANVMTSVTNSIPVTYQWYNNNGTDNPGTAMIGGQTTSTLTALPTLAGTYSYQVVATSTIDNTCSADKTVNLTIHPLPIVAVDDVLECNGNTGTITAVASNGTSPFTYSWSGPSLTDPGNVANFDASVAGIYSVTVVDANNCSSTDTGELTFIPKACLPVKFTIRRGSKAN